MSFTNVTKLVEALAEGRSGAEYDNYCYLDAKVKISGGSINKATRFPNVIVFIMGGGCYSECFNLQVSYLKYINNYFNCE